LVNSYNIFSKTMRVIKNNCFRYATYLLNALRSIKLQTRLIGSFFIISLIPLLITGVLSYNKSSHAMKSKISRYSIQVVDQISQNIRRELARLEYDSIDIAFSQRVQNVLNNYNELTEWEVYDTELGIQKVLAKKFSFLHDVSDVLLYTNDADRIVAYGDNTMYRLDLEKEYRRNLLKTVYEKKGEPVWTIINRDYEKHYIENEDNDNRYGVVICRTIADITDGKQLGYIIIRTNEHYFSNIYKDIDIGHGADIFIMNSEGMVVSSRNSQIEVSKKYRHKEVINKLHASKMQNTQSFKLSLEGDLFLAAYSPIKNTDWYVVSTIPFSYLNSESKKIGLYTFAIGIICFFAAIILSIIISESVSIPLNKLIASMNEAKKGNFYPGLKDRTRDEIAEVSSNFNEMLYEINTLLESIKNKEKQKRVAELNALQAQINPHFLSNTLNTAKWLASIQRAGNIEELITSLIELLHISMSKDNELISVREEIEYVKNYITIQKYRYYEKFKVRFEIQDEVLDCKILKLILQPLVENSIMHGIKPLDTQGLIIVKVFKQEGNLKITVSDNGAGIPEDVKKSIFSEDKQNRKSKFSGIGLPNINERIKLYFGSKYGIQIVSVPYVITKFEIVLPVIKGEREE